MQNVCHSGSFWGWGILDELIYDIGDFGQHDKWCKVKNDIGDYDLTLCPNDKWCYWCKDENWVVIYCMHDSIIFKRNLILKLEFIYIREWCLCSDSFVIKTSAPERFIVVSPSGQTWC